MTDQVKVQIDAGVMTITLSRPEKKNALSNAMYGVLADQMEYLQAHFPRSSPLHARLRAAQR